MLGQTVQSDVVWVKIVSTQNTSLYILLICICMYVCIYIYIYIYIYIHIIGPWDASCRSRCPSAPGTCRTPGFPALTGRSSPGSCLKSVSRPWDFEFLRAYISWEERWFHNGSTQHSMYLDMGFETLKLKSCESKAWELTVGQGACATFQIPDGMPCVLLCRPEALGCRVLIPTGAWSGLTRHPPSLGFEPHTSCIWEPILNQLRYRCASRLDQDLVLKGWSPSTYMQLPWKFDPKDPSLYDVGWNKGRNLPC